MKKYMQTSMERYKKTERAVPENRYSPFWNTPKIKLLLERCTQGLA